MKTEEIIERLRNPQKYANQAKKVSAGEVAPATPLDETVPLSSIVLVALAIVVLAIAAIVFLITLNAKKRAENVTEALDPQYVQGLTYEAEFNPNKNVTYVQIQEGQDRNVAVDQLGSTLPIISRYNYQAITPKNYEIIGMAPWALTENFSANINDPDIIRYLLNREEVASAFIAREDVAPLLADPQLLAAFAQDNDALNNFFTSNTVQSVLANPAMIKAVAGSRFMSHLLVSKAVKYYRNHPQEAIALINASPSLSALKQNAAVRQAVEENYYLKSIAPQLLGKTASTKAVK